MEKINRSLLPLAGLINVFFFVFHILFYNLFAWEKSLTVLNRLDWAIFMTYHLIVLLMIAAMAYISIRHARYLLQTSLGKPVLLLFSLFYLLRIAAEFLFFGYDSVRSVGIIVLCLLPAVAYLNAFLYNYRFLRKIDFE